MRSLHRQRQRVSSAVSREWAQSVLSDGTDRGSRGTYLAAHTYWRSYGWPASSSKSHPVNKQETVSGSSTQGALIRWRYPCQCFCLNRKLIRIMRIWSHYFKMMFILKLCNPNFTEFAPTTQLPPGFWKCCQNRRSNKYYRLVTFTRLTWSVKIQLCQVGAKYIAVTLISTILSFYKNFLDVFSNLEMLNCFKVQEIVLTNL